MRKARERPMKVSESKATSEKGLENSTRMEGKIAGCCI